MQLYLSEIILRDPRYGFVMDRRGRWATSGRPQ